MQWRWPGARRGRRGPARADRRSYSYQGKPLQGRPSRDIAAKRYLKSAHSGVLSAVRAVTG